MTGGAVIRLAEGLSGVQLSQVYELFAPEAKAHNVHSMVLCELALCSSTPLSVLDSLEKLCLADVRYALRRRVGALEPSVAEARGAGEAQLTAVPFAEVSGAEATGASLVSDAPCKAAQQALASTAAARLGESDV